MMLDTDLCLAFNGKLDPKFLAQNSDCCTWWNAPDNTICGTDRASCCGGNPDAKDCGGVEGTKLTSGAAGDDVEEFAAKDNKWIQVFEKAWTRATEKGWQ